MIWQANRNRILRFRAAQRWDITITHLPIAFRLNDFM